MRWYNRIGQVTVPCWYTQVGVGVRVGVKVGVGVNVCVGVKVGSGVAVGVGLAVGIGVGCENNLTGLQPLPKRMINANRTRRDDLRFEVFIFIPIKDVSGSFPR
jgi:hypothetical protein